MRTPAPEVRHVIEQAIAAIAEEHRSLALEGGGVEIQAAVIIVIPHSTPMVPWARRRHRRPRHGAGLIPEAPVAVVDKQEVAGLVVAHEQVGIAIRVEVGRDHPMAAPSWAAMPDASLASLKVPSPLLR